MPNSSDEEDVMPSLVQSLSPSNDDEWGDGGDGHNEEEHGGAIPGSVAAMNGR